MAGSALLTLYRSLTRHRLYAVLNVGGLALGIAVFLVLFLFVRYERGYDNWNPEARQLYLVQQVFHISGMPPTPYDDTMGAMLDELRADFPGLEGTRIWKTGAIVRQGADATNEDLAVVDRSFFALFPYRFLAGNPATALDDPYGVVLTKSIADKYFVPGRALGAAMTLVINGKPLAYHVTGVVADAPTNVSIAPTMMVSFVRDRFKDQFATNWGAGQMATILRFTTPAAAQAMLGRMPAFIARHGETDLGPDAKKMIELKFLPLLDLHFEQAGDRAIVTTLGLVGLITLLIAIVNYINLATARAGLRAREVALRKVLGGTRASLVRHFLAEALVTASVAALIGLALTEITLPFVNRMGGTALRIGYFGAGSILPVLLLVIVVTGLLAGLYPALVLSRFQPAAVLAAARAPGGGRAGARLRQALVVLQFAAAIAFSIGTGVLLAQVQHLRGADLGFQRNGLVVINSFVDETLTHAQRETLLTAFRAMPGVTAVTEANTAPGFENTVANSSFKRPGTTGFGLALRAIVIGRDFFSVFRPAMIAGRVLDDAHGLDSVAGLGLKALEAPHNVVITRAAAAKLGFASPAAALGQHIFTDIGKGAGIDSRIVGVIEDVRFDSPHAAAPGAVYSYQPGAVADPIATIRYDGVPARALIDRLDQIWRTVAPGTPFKAETANAQLYDAYYKEAAQRSRLFTIGAVLAVLIGCIGLYGLASFDTARRVKEIGIRKTLGASTRDIMRLLIGQFLRPVILANLIAWPIAFFAMRKWLSGFDDRVALSPAYFIAATLVAVGIAAVTVFGHAWRVARAEPARALRYE